MIKCDIKSNYTRKFRKIIFNKILNAVKLQKNKFETIVYYSLIIPLPDTFF